MLLVIDVGNTNLEFGLFRGKELAGSFRMATNPETTSDEIGFMVSSFLAFNRFCREEIKDVIIASVVPQVMYSLLNAVKKYIGISPLVVGETIEVKVPNLYDHPREVGMDRLVNARAGFEKYGGPLIIVDFGTATTFDAVDQNGAYLGGAIYPGIKISMEALVSQTAKLPRVELVNPGIAIGTNTATSMQVGAVYGYLGAIQNISAQMRGVIGADAKIVATGGLSNLFAQFEGAFDVVDKTITLDGLRMIYDDSQAAGRGGNGES